MPRYPSPLQLSSVMSARRLAASILGPVSAKSCGGNLARKRSEGGNETRQNPTARRLVYAICALGLLSLFGFARPAAAQATTPLSLFNNYFVTGDYVVGGVGLRGLGVNGFATGTISIPDTVQAQATGVPSPGVPVGSDIVAAFLYWETVESSQSAFAGQSGSFNGYPIVGSVLGNPNAPVSWSSGGCSGSSQGSKTMRTYRADVRPYLPVDATGRIQANGSYQVKLADSGSNGGGAPLTLGATLVIIYRVQNSTLPLNSIVLYDGAYAPSNSAGTMTEPIAGFYQAAQFQAAKITQIVGNGQSNKSETVSLNTVNLPSLYGNNPPFPGIYNGSWDNPTWFPNAWGAAVKAGDSTETTSVVPASTNSGCVSWGAIIFSTAVQNSDGDGLLDVWKANQGYTDVATGQWVALPGAKLGQKDIFVEVDYLTNLDGSDGTGSYLHSHLPKQAALDTVGAAFANAGVHVHFDVGNVYQSSPDPYIIPYNPNAAPGGNAISEGLFLCTDSSTLCAFPGVPIVGWKGGFQFIRDNATVPNTTYPLGSFQHGRKDSYHYVLFGHALGYPRSYWGAVGLAPNIVGDGVTTLSSIVVSSNVGTVTLLTPAPTQNPAQIVKPGDLTCKDANCDRVTVEGALQPQDAALNGTYKFLAVPSSVLNTATNIWTTTFTIQTSGVADGTYAYSNEPQLGVSYGGPVSTSGHSDVGGADTAVTFGLWPADDVSGCQPDPSVPLLSGQSYCTNQVGTITAEAGTLMHELGHTLTLTHGGAYYPANAANQGQPTQINNLSGPASYDWNCKPNYVSVMNYLFQIRGFPDGGIDYSGQTLQDLSEASLSEQIGIGSDLFTSMPATHFTRWYAPPNSIDTKLQSTAGGRYATVYCDGTPIPQGTENMVRVDGGSYSAPIDWNNNLTIDPGIDSTQDVNLNGIIGDSALHGFSDWANLDLRQIGARGSVFGSSDGIIQTYGGGIIQTYGGGIIQTYGGGIISTYGGGIIQTYGGGIIQTYGGGIIQTYGGGAELDSDTANSTVDRPSGLTAVQSGHNVVLNWTSPGFGQIRKYYVWRAVGSFTTLQSVLANYSAFSNIKTLTGNPPSTTYTDNNTKNKVTYTYFVTDANKQGAQSGPSNPATLTVIY